jgi:hypothetical protein
MKMEKFIHEEQPYGTHVLESVTVEKTDDAESRIAEASRHYADPENKAAIFIVSGIVADTFGGGNRNTTQAGDKHSVYASLNDLKRGRTITVAG